MNYALIIVGGYVIGIVIFIALMYPLIVPILDSLR